MSDQTTQITTMTQNPDYVLVNGVPLPTRRTRRNITIVLMLFCSAIIFYLLKFGSDENSLHTSALAWSYMCLMATFFAYCFGAVADNFNIIKNIKT